MIHPLDDYPIHQTPEPLLHVGTDSANAYDRFFFNGFEPDGSVFFAVAFGVYPNRRIMDGAFSIVVDGVQHNVRASRRSPSDRTQTTAGPLTIEVVEPMRQHRIIVTDSADNPDHRHGVSADLTYTAISPVIEEPRFRWAVDGRVLMDYTRLTQFGRWSGWIQIDGRRIEISRSVTGVRDRSWGTRPVGNRIEVAPSAPQFFWLWTPTIFPDVCTHFALNHDEHGKPWHQSGAIVPRISAHDPTIDPGRVQRATTAEADISWQQGGRWVETLTTRLGLWQPTDGKSEGESSSTAAVTYEPLLNFHMVGIGYRHPSWGHGCWVGENVSTRDHYDLADINPVDPEFIHIQAISRARWGDRAGVGVVEQLIIGPHSPTGLTGIVDGFATP